MEKILNDQLYNYLSNFNRLSDNQFGFRKFHSTATALLDCTNDWYTNLDRKMFNLVVQVDLKKAFDTVDHQILLRKLEIYGIKHHALALLESYLSNRNQKCQINGYLSSKKMIKCGIPQGSILGPLFFLLYINDLPQCLSKTKPRLFADDTNLTASGDSIPHLETAVNSDLENLRKWLTANRLTLNVAKTEFMLIGSKQMVKSISDLQLKVVIENKPVKRVVECKTLGVTLDQHLSWKINTENICNKITSGISALRRLKEFIVRKTLVSVYNAIVRPYFDYISRYSSPFNNALSLFYSLQSNNYSDFKVLNNNNNKAKYFIMTTTSQTTGSGSLDVFFVHSSKMADEEIVVVRKSEDNPLHREVPDREGELGGRQTNNNDLVQAIVADRGLSNGQKTSIQR